MIRDLEPAKYCLGIEVLRNKEGIRLSQAGYIRDTLEKFGICDCKPAQTPLNTSAKLHELKDEDDISDLALPYRELLGSLMYLAQGTLTLHT